jgi:AcrR family transcriptional regulator
MARPKSPDKRNAILAAATRVFAERGLGAPTAAISAAAGLAEGTLFTYFPTKDDLVHALYRDLKLELGDTMLAGYPRRKSIKDRMRHVWNAHLDWGLAHPASLQTLQRIEVWAGLTEAARQAGAAPFAEIQAMADTEEAARLLRPHLTREFIVQTLKALGEVSMDFMRRQPKRADVYRQLGFDMLWAAITRTPRAGGTSR